MAGPASEEPPFRPRLRPSAFLRSLRGGPPGPAARSPFVLPTLAATLFCFYQVFLAFDRMEGNGVSAPMVDAKSPVAWFLLGAGCAGLMALAMQHRVEPKAGLKPGAVRETAREAWAALRARARGWAKKARAPPGDGAPAEVVPPPQGR